MDMKGYLKKIFFRQKKEKFTENSLEICKIVDQNQRFSRGMPEKRGERLFYSKKQRALVNDLLPVGLG